MAHATGKTTLPTARIGRMEIDHSEVPVRLFKSDFLEFFTHISPVAVLAVWLPVGAFFLVRAIRTVETGMSLWRVPVGFVLGAFIWTLTEYAVHRFVFHYHPTSPPLQRFFFLFHGVHHYQPQCKTRLVMPPAASVPMAILFYVMFSVVIGTLLGAPDWVAPIVSGFIAGYLAYDMIHYATHHFPMRSGYLKFVKRYHMQHHYKTPDQRFGVSSPLWDAVFGTRPVA